MSIFSNDQPLYIFDLDGTLADGTHRTHHLFQEVRDYSSWRKFYAECHDDKPIWSVINTMEHLRSCGSDVWIFSGRSDEVWEKTVRWLEEYTSFREAELILKLVMRPAGNTEQDHLLKKGWYENMLEVDRKRLVAIFDDRQRVVDMWRSLGLTCFQVAPGNF
jgi:phosphoglycolate phosphatase-like HAD superfamily hydrolase